MQHIRIDRIRQTQDEENWISSLKIHLVGDVARFSATEAKVCALIAPDYEKDQSGLLFFCLRSTAESEDRAELACLVVPEQLQEDFLHRYHTSMEGRYRDRQGRMRFRGCHSSLLIPCWCPAYTPRTHCGWGWGDQSARYKVVDSVGPRRTFPWLLQSRFASGRIHP